MIKGGQKYRWSQFIIGQILDFLIYFYKNYSLKNVVYMM